MIAVQAAVVSLLARFRRWRQRRAAERAYRQITGRRTRLVEVARDRLPGSPRAGQRLGWLARRWSRWTRRRAWERGQHHHADMMNRCVYEHADGRIYCDYDATTVAPLVRVNP